MSPAQNCDLGYSFSEQSLQQDEIFGRRSLGGEGEEGLDGGLSGLHVYSWWWQVKYLVFIIMCPQPMYSLYRNIIVWNNDFGDPCYRGPRQKLTKFLEYEKCPRDFVVLPVSRHFLYSRDFVVFPVSRHIWTDVGSGPLRAELASEVYLLKLYHPHDPSCPCLVYLKG